MKLLSQENLRRPNKVLWGSHAASQSPSSSRMCALPEGVNCTLRRYLFLLWNCFLSFSSPFSYILVVFISLCSPASLPFSHQPYLSSLLAHRAITIFFHSVICVALFFVSPASSTPFPQFLSQSLRLHFIHPYLTISRLLTHSPAWCKPYMYTKGTVRQCEGSLYTKRGRILLVWERRLLRKNRAVGPNQLSAVVWMVERIARGLQTIRVAGRDCRNEDGGTMESTTCDWRVKWREWWWNGRVK